MQKSRPLLSLNPPGQGSWHGRWQTGFEPPSVLVAHPPHVVERFVPGAMQRVIAPRAVHRKKLQGVVTTGGTGTDVVVTMGPKKAKLARQLSKRILHSLQ